MNERKKILIAVACAAVLAFLPGCASTGGAGLLKEAKVTMTPDARFQVNGRLLAVEQLPKALRSMGAGPETTIKIMCQETPTGAVITRVVGALERAGYVRVFVVGPRKAEAIVGPAPPGGPPPAR